MTPRMTPALENIRRQIESLRQNIASLRNLPDATAIRTGLLRELGRLYDTEAELYVAALDEQMTAPRVRNIIYRRPARSGDPPA